MLRYYPEPWMWTSCDIDILLKENLGHKEDGKGSHDISLFSPSNVYIELHYGFVENDRVNAL